MPCGRFARRVPLRVVVDTNIWVSALVNPDGAPGQVIQAVLRGDLVIVASWALAEELAGVLSRPKLRRYEITPEEERRIMVLLAGAFPPIELDIPTRDPDDAPVVAAALVGNAEAIVTGDRDLLDDRELRSWLAERGVEVVTPAELLDRLR
jgi:putative PIN family toxin of toxin-antitoxin system